MIRVTKLNGEVFALNSDLIVNIDETPDTVLVLVTGQTFRVRESLDEVCRRVIEFRREINLPSQGVRMYARGKAGDDDGETEQ
jgi:flagellar protein FlbD